VAIPITARRAESLRPTADAVLGRVTWVSDVTADRRATLEEVLAHREKLRELASAAGLGGARVAANGALIVHPPDSGYRATVRFAVEATAVVGAWVQTITDDAPAASVETQPL
jgi:hypothetical protein